MDSKTLDYYSENSEAILKKYRSAEEGISKYFNEAFLEGSLVLDIGCGSGRDLMELLSQGFKVNGVDSCPEFIESASIHYPELKGKIFNDSLPELKDTKDNFYDGVLCSAVLMHLSEEYLFDAVYSIRRILKENGRLLISVPFNLKYEDNRDSEGRLFNGVPPENFQLLFERKGFRLIDRWDSEDSLGREDRIWAVMLFSIESD